MPEMRYASDESDTDEDASPASKEKKARKARKAKAGSDKDEDASPVARRPKRSRRSAAAKEVRSRSERAVLTSVPPEVDLKHNVHAYFGGSERAVLTPEADLEQSVHAYFQTTRIGTHSHWLRQAPGMSDLCSRAHKSWPSLYACLLTVMVSISTQRAPAWTVAASM